MEGKEYGSGVLFAADGVLLFIVVVNILPAGYVAT